MTAGRSRSASSSRLQILQTFAGVGSDFEDRAYQRVKVLYATTTYQTSDWIDTADGDLCIEGQPEVDLEPVTR